MANEASGIERAAMAAGGSRPLAKALGVSRQVVEHWIKVGYVPPARVAEVSAATGLSFHDLNPGVFPAALSARSRAPELAG